MIPDKVGEFDGLLRAVPEEEGLPGGRVGDAAGPEGALVIELAGLAKQKLWGAIQSEIF